MLPPAPPPDSRERVTRAMVLLNAFSTPLMLSSVNVGLPGIAEALGIDAVLLGWVPLAYLLASAMFVLPFGRLADIVGRKRVFLAGTAGVIVTSLTASLAQSGEQLVALRFAQGVFTAMLYATQMALVSSVVPPARRGRAIGATVSTIYVGLMVGPVLGGWLIETFDWRACFLLNVPLALAVLAIGLARVPGDWKSETPGGFDLPGAALYGAALLAVMLGLADLPAAHAWLALGVGLALFAAFLAFERRVEHPLFDAALFLGNRLFSRSCLASFLLYTATFANVVLVSLYLQYLKALTPLTAGLVMMVQPFTMAVFSPLMGRLSERIEPRLLASAGLGLTALGLLALATLEAATPLGVLVAALAATGLGFSLFSAPNTNAIMGAVEKHQFGAASGTVATMRLVGQMCSMGIVSMALALSVGAVAITPEVYGGLNEAIRLCYLAAAALCLPGIALSLARGRAHAAA